jgi:sorbitol-specific phosphotransferase system component IIC
MMDTLDNLFHQGGPLFMGILTTLLLVLLAMTGAFIAFIVSGRAKQMAHFRHRLTYLKSLGLFTMITGILGQLIGLMMAFEAIERAGDISPAIMYGGLKISMYTTLYGIFIYMLSIFIWFLLDLWHHKKLEL